MYTYTFIILFTNKHWIQINKIIMKSHRGYNSMAKIVNENYLKMHLKMHEHYFLLYRLFIGKWDQ